VVSSLLLQMDRLPSYVVVVTASNHPELLDRAVWRRFQLCLELKSPTKSNINSYINIFTERCNCKFNYSTKTLSDKLFGNSYAEIEEFCVTVLRKAVLQQKQDNAREIVSNTLKQWQSRFSVKIL